MNPTDHSPHMSLRHAGRGRRLRRGAALVALFAAAVTVLAFAAPAWSATTNVTMVGRGWGHGIGMSQWGAYGYAKNGWTYDKILEHYYTGIKLGKVENAVLRVRLRGGVASAKVTCANDYRAYVTGAQLEIPGGVTAVVSWAGGRYKVVAGSQVKTFGAPVTFKPLSGQLATVTTDDWGKAGRYRGLLRVLHSSAGFTIVNKLPLESYLRGVVPLEVSSSWPAAALKAQACAARSYAERSRKPGEAFDVYCTTRDQAYGGVRAETTATSAAVKACAGVVPTYDGKPIAAFFFSTSGGRTENIENVWQTAPIPYLKGVDDPYDTFSPLHLWPDNPIAHGDAWYEDKLGPYGDQNPTGVKGDLRTIFVVKRGTSPRVVKAAIIGTKGTTFVSGASLRYKLALRDTWVSFASMSNVPASTTVTSGVGTKLSGRIYPALKDGATVTLRYVREGASGSLTVPTVRHSQDLGSGFSATYSTYSLTVKPKKQTTYFFVSVKVRSPKVTLKVRPAVSMTANATSVAAGDVIKFGGTTTPLLPGAAVWLQTKSGDAWTNAANAVFDADGACAFEWTAAAGVTAARLRVPATAGFVTGFGPRLALTVTG